VPGIHPPVTLQLHPHTIPAVRVAFEESLLELRSLLIRFANGGFIDVPWMGDPVSESVRVDYNSVVMGPKDSLYAAMVGYEAELTRIHQSLQLMEEHYRRTEGEEAARWARQA
jgi:hypothetical protein